MLCSLAYCVHTACLQVAGGPGESVSQPLWSDGELSFVSDRTDWWNIYTETSSGKVRTAQKSTLPQHGH